MQKNRIGAAWAKALRRSWATLARQALKNSARAKPLVQPMKPIKPAAKTRGQGAAASSASLTPGRVVGPGGTRRYRLYCPPGVAPGERLPLLVMLHGCAQDAASFATSTRMNRVAARQRFVVLYPEQDRLANAQGCWNWFDTKSGRAAREADLVMQAIQQVCALHAVDPGRVAIAGLSAGASLGALLVTRHPGRFKALVMHSGVPPGTAHSGLTALGAMRGRRATAPLATTACCTPEHMARHWPALLVIQGGADGVVAPRNGQAAAQVWADAAEARAGPTREVQRGQRYAMRITDFKRERRLVCRLVEVPALAHAWSGGAPKQPFSDPRGPDASSLLWGFAAQQFVG